MTIRYLGLARLKTEGEVLAVSLAQMKDLLLPGLQEAHGITRRAIADNQYKLAFDNAVQQQSLAYNQYQATGLTDMCASKGSLPLPPSQQSAELLTQFTQDVDLRQNRVIDVPDGGETVTVPAVNGRILDLD
jgi:hypothetical protein